MGRSKRRQKLEWSLSVLETDFRKQLIDALEECAGGTWGLFGQNDEAYSRETRQLQDRLESDAAKALIALGEEVTEQRVRIGISEPFPLYEKYLKIRESSEPNSPGEPRLAQEWLKDLAAE